MADYMRYPHCNSINISKVESKDNPQAKLFISTIEVNDKNNSNANKIYADQGFAFDAYVCNDCNIVTLVKPTYK